MRLCVYATTFQADIQAFTVFAAAQPGVEALLVVDSAATARAQPVNALLPLPPALAVVERGDPRLRSIVEGFRADALVVDNHLPSIRVAPRLLVLWHGYGWRLDDLGQMRKEIKRRWGDATRANPSVLWAAFGEVDLGYRTTRSRLHPDNVAALGSPYSDLLLPASAFQRAFSRGAVAGRYAVDVAGRKNVLLALTWHHGSALGQFGDDAELFGRLFAELDARGANVIMRMHDRHRSEPELIARLERIAAGHANVQLGFKDERPDTLVDLSISDVMVSNYSSILNHFYFLGRPTVHVDPADAAGRYADFRLRGGRLRKRAFATAAEIWKIPPEEIGGLRARSFDELLAAVRRGLDEPACCAAASAAFVARHYAGADGGSCARVLDAVRRRWEI
jgi:hypothetical protein